MEQDIIGLETDSITAPSLERALKREIIEIDSSPSPPPKRHRICPRIKEERPKAKFTEVEKLQSDLKKLTKDIEEAERLVEMKRKREDLRARLEAARGQ